MNDTDTENALVDAIGSIRRLRALVAIGHDPAQLASQLGMLPGHVELILEGGLQQVLPGTRDTISALFRRLWIEPVSTEAGEAPRDLARKRGWVGPLAWDNIDDPAEEPNVTGPPPKRKGPALIDHIAVELAIAGRLVKLTRAEKRYVLIHLHAEKWSDRRIAGVLRVNERTVFRHRKLLGLKAHDTAQIEGVNAA